MKYHSHLVLCIIISSLAAATASVLAGSAWAEDKSIPAVSEISAALDEFFDKQNDYESGDLITGRQVEPLLDLLQERGLPLHDRKEILADLPVDDEFLVKQFGTPAGVKFMRQIARFPDAYDRVDRLSRLPRGRQTVADLIRGPDGYKMIEYFTTAAGGKELGRMLSESPAGRDFNNPTGRIYTADLLLERLKQSREESIKTAEAKAKN